MRTKVVFAAVAVGLLGTPAIAAPLTLEDALGVAYETNPQLDAQRALLRATDQGVAKANAGWRPSINLSGSWGAQKLRQQGPPVQVQATNPLSGEVDLSQPVFTGGKTVAEISKAKALVRAGRAQLTAAEETVLLAAATAYADVLRDQAIVRAQTENVSNLTTLVNGVKAEVSVGTASNTDLAQAQGQLAGAQAALSGAEGQLGTSRSGFLHAIGRPAETLETDPKLPLLPKSLDDALNITSAQSPTIVQAMENAKAADYAVDSAVGELLPQASIEGQYQYNNNVLNSGLGGSGQQTFAAVVGKVTIPIYQGGADFASVRAAKDTRAQAELSIADAQRQADDATRSAWQVYTSADASIGFQVAQEEADRKAFEGVKQEQLVGTATILDTLIAAQNLVNAEIAVATARHDTLATAYQVLQGTGQLTAMQLRLKVNYYDPGIHYDDAATSWIGLGE